MTNARTVHCQEHTHQVGVCPACQRARLAAEKEQLAEAQTASRGEGQTVLAAERPERNTM